MCGIVGYIGTKEAYNILIKGLQRLEYRGYDSAGVAILNDTDLSTFKCKGKVADLQAFVGAEDPVGSVGIGHTRWATHGLPNDVNAHPHSSSDGNLAMIHNGIIENYDVLKEELQTRGYDFQSETDTEVLVKLIEDIRKTEADNIFDAVRIALSSVVGAYAIAIIDKREPNRVIVARKSSPLVVGIAGDGEYLIASDATPIVEYTKNVVYLEDEEIAILDRTTGLTIKNISNEEKAPYIQELEMNLEALEKGGYEHFMMKEIFEQPRSIYDCFRGRLLPTQGVVSLGGIKDYEDKIANAKRIIMIACGTSWHAALVGEYLIEELCRIPVEVEYASEFRYRNPIINSDDVVIAISQSGETADTLAAIELSKRQGATVLGICNVAGSSISRATHGGSYTHAGPEIGVASTKAFTAQVTVLTLMSLMIGKKRNTIDTNHYYRLISELNQLPEKVEKVLEKNSYIEHVSEVYKDVEDALYLGRGNNFPVALEGALKLKEISYIHAEGYPAAEMKHGPIALIDENLPVFVIATEGAQYEKMVSNIQEVKARKGQIIAIVTEGDTQVKAIADHVIEVPKVDEHLSPLINSIPLQLISYHIAVMRGCDVDQPRNLAKSVTVE